MGVELKRRKAVKKKYRHREVHWSNRTHTDVAVVELAVGWHPYGGPEVRVDAECLFDRRNAF